MRLFSKSGDKRAGGQPYTQKIDDAVLAHIEDFAYDVELLQRHADIRVRIVSGSEMNPSGNPRGAQPYYMFVYTGDADYSCLDAGYVAGQVFSYLQFLGFSAAFPRSLPLGFPQEEGYVCRAVVMFGRTLPASFGRRRQEQMERPCIYRDFREKWAEEILKYTKKRFPFKLKSMQIIRREDRISLVPKAVTGKKAIRAKLETGIAAAFIMAAAEELWMELSFVDKEDAEGVLSVCRRQDQAKISEARRKSAENGAKHPLPVCGLGVL